MNTLQKIIDFFTLARHAWVYHDGKAHRHCARCHLDESRDTTAGAYGPAWLE